MPIDFTRLQGRRIGVLGGGASAYDNAATALEHGAASVDLYFRRPQLHRINPHKWTEFAGFLDHFRDLSDEWRWRFMRHILPLNEPPPPETFLRATRYHCFHLHLGRQWDRVDLVDGEIVIADENGPFPERFDHLLIAIGLKQDLTLRPELAVLEPKIARWRDVYSPPASERHEGLAEFPYLGPYFEYTERTPGEAPFLRDIYNFTAAATVSHGPSGASINGMKQAAQRIAAGICRDLFTQSVQAHWADLLTFATPELDVPWLVAEGHGHPNENEYTEELIDDLEY
jgi:cation diffusion facilitator CzcD-associated flavoprotein CzcO